MDLQALKTAARRGVIALSSCLLLVACKQEQAVLPYYNSADLTPAWEQGSGKHTIAEYSFTDQDGQEVTNSVYDGKIYVANFFFTSCPGICPKMTNNLMIVADSLNDVDELMFLSHSVTPYIDSVPKLKEFAEMHDLDSDRWKLVTGVQSNIYEIARESYFAEDEMGFNYDSTDFLHTERVTLVDKNQHIRGVYNGTVELDMYRLIDDIKLLLRED